MTALFQARGMGVRFGGTEALKDVDIGVEEGQLVGLIGPNGAGKTTFIDAITGFVNCRGSIQLDGRELGSSRPHLRARRGLVRTWQSIELFDALTVRENLLVATQPTASPGGRLRRVLVGTPGDAAAADRALELLELDGAAYRMPEDLSQGQRKLVGVARALATGARLICLDEPAAGLDTTESEALGRILRRVVDEGTSMLLIDHDMSLVLGICDHLYVLDFGRLIASGPPEVVRSDPRVVTAYLGSAAEALA